jgi:DNA-binding transcriptional regulator YdaS (Cro superfamily)
MSRELIEQAITLAGSQAKLAEACGVKQQSIWQAKETGRCSAELALQIEQATDGKVTARQLRPDLPWPSLAPEQQPEGASAEASS